ncbi:MAG: hypothetical protein GY870_12645 [archaeon]|nr:hypothetical protein [archaeon]
MGKKYPTYIGGYGDDSCYERYAERLREGKGRRFNIKYPIKKNFTYLYLKNFRKCLIHDMSPIRFLSKAYPKAHVNQCSVDYLFDGFLEGEPKLPPLYLDVNEDNRVIGHEGRHRAEIAKDLGVLSVPVVICYGERLTMKESDRHIEEKYQDEVFNEEFQLGKGNYYDKLIETHKDAWQYPDNIHPRDIKREGGNTRDIMRERNELRKIHKEKRDKYNIDAISKSL